MEKPSGMLSTYPGHEKKVKVNIEKLVENRGMQAGIGSRCVIAHRGCSGD